MKLTDALSSSLLLLDGGTGTVLQKMGLQAGEATERWNLTHPDRVTALHRAYFDAGSNIVCTNTFGVNALKYDEETVETLVSAAIACAEEARSASSGSRPKWIALDLGPLGRLLRPLGDLGFEDAVNAFAPVVRAGVKSGADLIVIETMSDSLETKAALLAAKENASLPVFVTGAYGEDGKLMTGASPEAMTALLEGMGADAIGVNCSGGPEQLLPVAERFLAASSVPVIFKPNAGLPRVENGETVYDVSEAQFAETVREAVLRGVRIVGGCCGTTPAHIRAVSEALRGLSPLPVTEKNETVVSSHTHAVTLGGSPVLIGERINPTGKKRMKQALIDGDLSYVLEMGLSEAEQGAQILDVNVGIPEADEPQLLPHLVSELQAVTDLPLQLDTSDPVAMERAMRLYNGKPMINSVNGKRESLDAILPLVKKYGGVLVALTLDENGIPETVEGRVSIARRILAEAEKAGIARKDVVFDPLALTVSADGGAPSVTLGAVKAITEELGCRTVLGVSNVSFGLPVRDAVNAAFLCMALQSGLSAAIMNPASPEMQKALRAFRALKGYDENCADYIAFASSLPSPQTPPPSGRPASAPAAETEDGSPLRSAIRRGLRDAAGTLTERALADCDPLEVVNREILPALDAMGRAYEEKTAFLPQLLMSAEAAKEAFSRVRSAMERSAVPASAKKTRIVLATVRGDVHDIGKNIVRLLLENYGFPVTDLGKDVPPEAVLEAAKREGAMLVGLSALMTTTVPAMEETVALLHKELPGCSVVVGGAVLTQEYADRIGADFYAKDAMDTVRAAQAEEEKHEKG